MSRERFSAGAVAYAASKAGITGVTGVQAVELASRGIRVNRINPGAVDTEGARAIGAMSDEARAAHITRARLLDASAHRPTSRRSPCFSRLMRPVG